jgi:hypothetical protein
VLPALLIVPRILFDFSPMNLEGFWSQELISEVIVNHVVNASRVAPKNSLTNNLTRKNGMISIQEQANEFC